ncbi:MAG: type II toxin-antitoxin system RelE/ParE family toxin [Clostridia bacterium]|nr:type II toxin-antitoxin system RelE/ParE family toxin [Clostridia bacterium]
MTEIKYSPEAQSDLQQTKRYITEELCSESAAVNTVKKITKKIRLLADFPEIGAPLSPIVGFDTDYRFLVCENYLAFYRYEQNTVYIDRVIYGRRDYMKILFGISSESDDDIG